MNKFYILPSVIVVILLEAFIVSPKKEFSENENRNLEPFPEVSAESLLSGDLAENLGTYIEDHFPFRDSFMELNGVFSVYVLGQKEVNGIYIGKDGSFLEKYNKPETMDDTVDKLNNLAEKTNSKVYCALVPTAAEIYSEKLPNFAEVPTQYEEMEEYYSRIKADNIDVYSPLYENKEEKLYYNLDHHWTTKAAYIAYREIAAEMGFEPFDESYFDIEQVTDDFKGTIYSKVNMGADKADTIELYKTDTDYTVTYTDTEEVSDSFYNLDYLDMKDKYSLFLNNLHPLTEIKNNSKEARGSLAVIKDSFANCLVPFLAKHYKTIYVFDTRYYRGSVCDFINENNIENTLILYNLNTIDTDLGIDAIY
ncbi:MAG: hypothetical protein LUH47_07800 [Clostridiales bacterium]|nr:hypothetical protein [Clostridiales bacterium]